VFRCIGRFGVSHGSHVEPGLTPKPLMGLDAMNYPNLLSMSYPTTTHSLRSKEWNTSAVGELVPRSDLSVD